MTTTNCSLDIATASRNAFDVIGEYTNNATIICNKFHLVITDDVDQEIFVQVKATNAIAFTFIACVLLLFFYSCCWFNRFNLCGVAPTPDIEVTRSFFDQGLSRSARDQDFFTIDIDQTHSPEQPELSRRYDIDLESLPSYTICSGLPTYDDALDQFRKYGIIIQPPSVIKIFEESSNSKTEPNEKDDDNISVNSTCTCGGNVAPQPATISLAQPNMIELNPEQLQQLSQKRLSLQIALNSSIRRSGRSGRVDLCREVNRSNLLRSHEIPPIIHRSASQQSLYHDRLLSQRLMSAQHRGSLC